MTAGSWTQLPAATRVSATISPAPVVPGTGLQFEEYVAVHDSRANQSFGTIEVAALKRLANRWQLLASYSATKKHCPISSPTFSAAREHGRRHLGLGCQGDRHLRHPGRGGAVGERPPHERRPVRAAGAVHRRPDRSVDRAERRADRYAPPLNLYNALNANTATGLQNRSGSELLRPRSILPPRLAEVAVSYRF